MARDVQQPLLTPRRQQAGPSSATSSTQHLSSMPPSKGHPKSHLSSPSKFTVRMPLGERNDLDNASIVSSEPLFLPYKSSGSKLRSPKVHRLARKPSVPSRLSIPTISTTRQTPAAVKSFWRAGKENVSGHSSRDDDTLVLDMEADEDMLMHERMEEMSSPGLLSPPPSQPQRAPESEIQAQPKALTPALSQDLQEPDSSALQSTSSSLTRFVHPYTTSIPPFSRLPTPPPSQEPTTTPRKPEAQKRLHTRSSPTPPRSRSQASLPCDVEGDYTVPLRPDGPSSTDVSPNPRRKKTPRTSTPRTRRVPLDSSRVEKSVLRSTPPATISSSQSRQRSLKTPYRASTAPAAPASAPAAPISSASSTPSSSSSAKRTLKTPRTAQPAAARRRAKSHNPSDPPSQPGSINRDRSRSLTPGGSIILGSQSSLTPAARRALKGREVGILDRGLEGTDGDDELLLRPLPKDSGLTERMKRIQRERVDQNLREKAGGLMSVKPAAKPDQEPQNWSSTSPEEEPLPEIDMYLPQVTGWVSDDGSDDDGESTRAGIGRDVDNDTFVHVLERKKAVPPLPVQSARATPLPEEEEEQQAVAEEDAFIGTTGLSQTSADTEGSDPIQPAGSIERAAEPPRPPTPDSLPWTSVSDSHVANMRPGCADDSESDWQLTADETLEVAEAAWDVSDTTGGIDCSRPALSAGHDAAECVRLLSEAIHSLPDKIPTLEAKASSFLVVDGTICPELANVNEKHGSEPTSDAQGEAVCEPGTENRVAMISDVHPVLEDLSLADVTLDAVPGEWSFSTCGSTEETDAVTGEVEWESTDVGPEGGDHGVSLSADAGETAKTDSLRITAEEAPNTGLAVTEDSDTKANPDEADSAAAPASPGYDRGASDGASSDRASAQDPTEDGQPITGGGHRGKAGGHQVSGGSEKIILRLVETVVKLESDSEDEEADEDDEEGGEDEEAAGEEGEGEEEASVGKDEAKTDAGDDDEADAGRDSAAAVETRTRQNETIRLVMPDREEVDPQGSVADGVLDEAANSEAVNNLPLQHVAAERPSFNAPAETPETTTPATTPIRKAQVMSTTPKATPKRSARQSILVSQASTTPIDGPATGASPRAARTPAIYPALPVAALDQHDSQKSKTSGKHKAPASPRPAARAPSPISTRIVEVAPLDEEVARPDRIFAPSQGAIALRHSLHTELLAVTAPTTPASFSPIQGINLSAASPVIPHKADQSIVQISSLDPRAAARAAAILKLNHQYIEQGVGGPSAAVDEFSGTATPSRAATTPRRGRKQSRRESRSRSRPFESPHFASVDSARKLNKDELLHEAERELVATEQAEKVDTGAGWESDDSEPNIPGAWKTTPGKRKRRTASVSSASRLGTAGGDEGEAAGVAWSVGDWKALEQVFRDEKQRWLNERTIRSLPATPSFWSWARSSLGSSQTSSLGMGKGVQAGPFEQMKVVRRFLAEHEGKKVEGEWSEGTILLRVQALEKRVSSYAARSSRHEKSTEARSPKRQRNTADMSTPRRSPPVAPKSTTALHESASSIVPPSTIKRVLGRLWAPFGFQAAGLNVSTVSLSAVPQFPGTPSPASMLPVETASLAQSRMQQVKRSLGSSSTSTIPERTAAKTVSQHLTTPARPPSQRVGALKGSGPVPHPLASSWIPATPPSPAPESGQAPGSTTPTHSPPARAVASTSGSGSTKARAPASLLSLTRPAPAGSTRKTRACSSILPLLSSTSTPSHASSGGSVPERSLYPPLRPSLSERSASLEALLNTSLSSSMSSTLSVSSDRARTAASPTAMALAVPTSRGSPSVKELARSLEDDKGLSKSWEGREREMQSLRRVLSARNVRGTRD